ncbi:MAG TPA: type 2 isopentenyl-diphosphate Delta-isomerase [Methanomassiliicoccales archaeon]|nr:type 2 isopentenyl-diphosphate Delta-isomerase [Methanomassiliicoccales archaeon]
MRQIEKRKADHIEVVLEEDVCTGRNYWDDVRLVHCSLPEADLKSVETSVSVFGRRLSFPLVVTAITGGYPRAKKINENIAKACAELQIGMGVGSQRAGLENGEESSYSVMKDYDIPLRIANLGAPQLVRQKSKSALGKEAAARAMEMVDGHLLAIHLNFLQEVAQPEGDTNAQGCLDAIRSLSASFPILAKETGAGISRDLAMRLKGIGVRGIDVSGTGGTSFSAVEAFRASRSGDERLAALGETFRDWGIPAPVATVWANVGIPVISSGGMHSGLDLAKGVALGAACGGVARSILPEATRSSAALRKRLEAMREEFRAAMFLTGSKSVPELQKKKYILTGEVKDWLSQVDG